VGEAWLRTNARVRLAGWEMTRSHSPVVQGMAHHDQLMRSHAGPSAVPETFDVDAAYTTFFRSEFPRVVRTIHLIVHDQPRAEDIAQDAFLRLLQNWSKISSYERPEAWVRRVAIRIAMRGRRRDQLWTAIRVKLLPAPPPGPMDFDVIAAIRRLPTSQRAAIALFYYEDRPVAEIAAILGCTESTARVHLHHGRRRLATLLGEEGPDVA
jgi:DNA-directed RNA polymerase specialized sigma24 family protein